jgi:hypothetical protein
MKQYGSRVFAADLNTACCLLDRFWQFTGFGIKRRA